MANDLMRFSVAMPEDLLVSFDRLVSRRGLAKNRSEVVRDLVRDALVEDECAMPGVEVAGSLTIVFDLVTAIAVGMLITVVLFMKSFMPSSMSTSATSCRPCMCTSMSTCAWRSSCCAAIRSWFRTLRT